MDYKTSGVDIIKGRSFVEYIKALAPNIGGFNGMMEVPSGYEKPVLVSGADGVGTKINICGIADDYATIGQDLVAMCVNDVICSGAKPLYFLDTSLPNHLMLMSVTLFMELPPVVRWLEWNC